jgi:type IV pilus assembly protein PilO
VNIGQAFNDLQNLDASDLKRIGSAPLAARLLVLALVLAAIVGAGIWLLIQPKFNDLQRVELKENGLRQVFDTEQAKAANRDAYLEQLGEMKKTFNVMLRQLPNKTDIESLLIDLSQTSVAAGLEVEYFKPEKEVAREFYMEYPIKISVTGNYHQFGTFISGLAALPRIVTLNNIAIVPIAARNADGNQPKSQKLKMDLTATTYRYLEEDEG